MAKFPIGQFLLTRGIADKIAEDLKFAEFVFYSLARHIHADWGELSEEDKRENEFSLKHNLRLLSAYERAGLPKIWIITEADRSATTILFAEEY